jgi:hypothetical protein
LGFKSRCLRLSTRPEIQSAKVQALTFRNDPKFLSYIATYEQKLTKNFQRASTPGMLRARLPIGVKR